MTDDIGKFVIYVGIALVIFGLILLFVGKILYVIFSSLFNYVTMIYLSLGPFGKRVIRNRASYW